MKIYALVDAREPYHFRYVGQTKKPLELRLRQHLHRARECRRTKCDKWIISTPRVDIVLLDEGDIWLECFYIAALREAGHRLTNGTDGGTGGKTIFAPLGPAHSEKLEIVWQSEERRRVALKKAYARRPVYAGQTCIVCGVLFSGWPFGRRKMKCCSPQCVQVALKEAGKRGGRPKVYKQPSS